MRVGSDKGIGPARGSRGFTLVELLIVMAIMAILASIAFPVISKAKQQAQITECLANMKQLGAAMRMYLDDNQDHFPPAVAIGIPWRVQQNTVQELLTPYVRNGMIAQKTGVNGYFYPVKSVFCCPSDTGIPQKDDTYCDIRAGRSVWIQTGSSYIYYAANQENYFLRNRPKVPWTALSPEISSGAAGSPDVRIGAPESAVRYPSRKAVLGDIWFWHLGDTVPPDGEVAFCNTLFCDGHAARVRGANHVMSRIEPLLKHWHSFLETGK